MEIINNKNNAIETFLCFEAQDCFDFKIDNVLIWKYLREFIYDTYINNVYHTENRVPKFSSLRFGLFFSRQLFRVFDINKFTQKDIVFLNFPRKIKINGHYQCTQLEPLIMNFKENSCVLENPFWLEDKSYLVSHFKDGNRNVIYTDKIEIIHRIRFVFLWLFKRIKFKKHNNDEIIAFCKRININLGTEIEPEVLFEKIFWYVSFEKYAEKHYTRILKKISPKCLIEVYTPNHHIALMNTVAHKLQIPIIDIQHGAIGDYEPIMYSYYNKGTYLHLSDYIFCFGEYWKNKENFHLNRNRIIPVGVPFLENQIKNSENANYEKNIILIISQTRYSKTFYNLAEELQKKFKNSQYRIVLKLHPYEYSLYKQGKYEKLKQMGIQVEAGLEKHLYSYLTKAKFVIGINSTALYEALAFKLPIFIYNNKYGIENLVELKKSIPLINIFDNTQMLLEQIDNFDDNFDAQKITSLFSNNSMNRILEAIKLVSDISVG